MIPRGVSGSYRSRLPTPDPNEPAPPEPVTPDSPELPQEPLPSYEDQPPINPIAQRMARPWLRGRAESRAPRVARARGVV
jgi:hypothetical protein